MNPFTQVPFDDAEFAENPEQRCPCVLLLDTSGSMQGAPITKLNEAIHAFLHEINNDTLAAKRVELAMVTFGPVHVQSYFTTVDTFEPINLVAKGMTPMGEAIHKAIDLVEMRKQSYKENGIKYYRPWIFLITDGSPTDDYLDAAQRVKKGEENKEFAFFSVAVEGADFKALEKISNRAPLRLQGLAFRELFSWLSSSLSSVSHSNVGDAVKLPNPSSWAEV